MGYGGKREEVKIFKGPVESAIKSRLGQVYSL